MKLANFLHIYQPHDQHPGTLEKIVNESYRPLLKGFLKNPKTKITLNISGALTEILFKNGYRDVIEDIKLLVELNRLELTASSKYHSFLPLLPINEVERQIVLNHEINASYFGKYFDPIGLFPPELGYSNEIVSVARKMGYKYILADESAICENESHGMLDFRKCYKIGNTETNIFFREKLPSNLMMGALVRSSDSFYESLSKRIDTKDDFYTITAMDGETFGHHRPGLERLLFEIMQDDRFENVLISDLLKLYKDTEITWPKDSTWASSIKDVKSGNPFNLWNDKHNSIHKKEWEMAYKAIALVNSSSYSTTSYPKLFSEMKSDHEITAKERDLDNKIHSWLKARDLLDKALNSDTMWWSSAKPWWSIEMIEKGINALREVVLNLPDVNKEEINVIEDLYKQILFTAHEWQRRGVVDLMALNDSAERRIPISKRLGAGDFYKALTLALKNAEKESVLKQEYEAAIKWRDALYKLEHDLDIYMAVGIVDMFRESGNYDNLVKILDSYRDKYRNVSKGQPE